jgi:hypothetical protein
MTFFTQEKGTLLPEKRALGKTWGGLGPGSYAPEFHTKEDKKWNNRLDKVIEKCAEPWSYRVFNEKGNIVICNHRDLLPCKDRLSVRSGMIMTILSIQLS